MRFDFGRAPGKFHFGLHAILLEIAFGQVDNFGGDTFALKIFHCFHRRIFRHAQDPARGFAGNFAEQKFADLVDVRAVFHHPIMAGDSAIQIAMLDVTADFLRADEADFHLRVVHVGDVRPAADGNVPSGFGHLLNGGVLQAALWQPEPEYLFAAHKIIFQVQCGKANLLIQPDLNDK